MFPPSSLYRVQRTKETEIDSTPHVLVYKLVSLSIISGYSVFSSRHPQIQSHRSIRINLRVEMVSSDVDHSNRTPLLFLSRPHSALLDFGQRSGIWYNVKEKSIPLIKVWSSVSLYDENLNETALSVSGASTRGSNYNTCSRCRNSTGYLHSLTKIKTLQKDAIWLLSSRTPIHHHNVFTEVNGKQKHSLSGGSF